MITENEIIAEGNRIKSEFSRFSKQITIKESFYHGTYGRCIRFEIEVLEGDIYRILFHQTGITVLNDSTHFESFDQFFDSKSPEYRKQFSTSLFEKLSLLSGQ